jgi:hypothetical protein
LAVRLFRALPGTTVTTCFLSTRVSLSSLLSVVTHVRFPFFSRLGGRVFDAVMQLIATVPVVMSAYVCHQSVHPVMSQVRAWLGFAYLIIIKTDHVDIDINASTLGDVGVKDKDTENDDVGDNDDESGKWLVDGNDNRVCDSHDYFHEDLGNLAAATD